MEFQISLLEGGEIDAAVTATATDQFAILSELTSLKTFIASFADHIAAEMAR